MKANPFSYLKLFRKYIGRRVYLVLFLSTITALSEILAISLILPLLSLLGVGENRTSGISTSGAHSLDNSLDQIESSTSILESLLNYIGIQDSFGGILVLIAFLFTTKGAATFFTQGYTARLNQRLQNVLRGQLFEKYAKMDYEYYLTRNTGHFINVITTQVNGLLQGFNNFAILNSSFVMAVFYFATAVLLTWEFALMVLSIGVLFIWSLNSLNSYVARLSRKVSDEAGEQNKFIIQSLQGFKYAVSTSQFYFIKETVQRSIERLTSFQFKQQLALAATTSIRDPLAILIIIGLILFQVTVLQQPLAPILVALILFNRGINSLLYLQPMWQTVVNYSGSFEMVDQEFSSLQKNEVPDGKITLEPFKEQIQLDNVRYVYPNKEKAAIDQLTLIIPANSTIAFVGASGAGKSTLVDLLTLLLKPSEGSIRIDDQPGDSIQLHSWRSQIGYVSQDSVMFDDTIANNIGLWQGDFERDENYRKRIIESARLAFAEQYINELPGGYNTIIGDRGTRLSGGQRQRLFIARELFKRPRLLILDEATSALDTESEQIIKQSIDALKGTTTVVVIAHRLSTVKNADQIYVLEEGKILEQGTFDELREKSTSKFRAMVEGQVV